MTPINVAVKYGCFLRSTLAVLLLLVMIWACTAESTPEAIVSAFRDMVEEAVEEGNSRALRKLISEQYRDDRGRTKAELGSIAAGYLLRNRSVHVLSRVATVERPDERTIEATILAAFSSRPIKEPSRLPSLNADIYWFEITLEEEDGDWLLRSAGWRQAMVDDFLGD